MSPSSSHVESLPGSDELRSWIASEARPRVSVYLPLEQATGAPVRNVQLRDQAVRELEKKLAALGVAAAPWTERIAALEVDVRHLAPRAAALAIFADPGALRALTLPLAVPYAVAAGDTFSLRPLLGLLGRVSRYRLLVLSPQRVALFEGGPDGLVPTAHPGLPANLEDALGSETIESELRMRGTRAGGNEPAYYTHGSGREGRELDWDRFHTVLAGALAHVVKDDGVPLVLAGTDHHRSALREALPGLIDESVRGNADRLAPHELHEQAWPLVERWCAARADAWKDRWERARNRGKGLDLFDDVAAAAVAGRVRTLWVDADLRRAGCVDPQTGRAVAGRGDDDAIDSLVEIVLAHSGEAHLVPPGALPSTSGVAAELH
jgi:hypothetical protein